MKDTVYIFSSGTLQRKDNTLFFETEEGDKKFIPIENTKEIFAFGEVTINKRLLEFLSQKEIILSYFSYYGYYMGSFYPREHYNSGYMILKQASFYENEEKRVQIALAFVVGAAKNCLKILKYYNRRGKNLSDLITKISDLLENLPSQKTVQSIMSIEAHIKQTYYQSFDIIIDDEDFQFDKRTKRPPQNYINALISFGNSMIYNYVLREIYQTHLDPRIGYLHSTNFRRFSLNLDVAEIFKPVISDRTIFSLLNKRVITKKDFTKDLNGILLNDDGKRKFLKHIEERMEETIKHSKLNAPVSYRRLMRLELYKLEKHFMGEESYEPFVMDW
ncbi:type I-B CRISPR-associated endonuclease Cas1 [bacterium]|nr:type I-B CRISPR-associated endonuclease Cas1 [bacterium]